MSQLYVAVGFLGLIVLVCFIARVRYRREIAKDRAVRELLGMPAPKNSSKASGGASGMYAPLDCSGGDGGGCD